MGVMDMEKYLISLRNHYGGRQQIQGFSNLHHVLSQISKVKHNVNEAKDVGWLSRVCRVVYIRSYVEHSKLP